MFDTACFSTYKDVPLWYRSLTRNCEKNMPIVAIGTKVDINDQGVRDEKQLSFLRARGIPYFGTSAKKGINLKEPFVRLVHMICGGDVELL